MAKETEVKLIFNDIDIIKKITDDKRLKGRGDFKIISMNGIYYDTNDFDLLKKNYVVRIRCENANKVLTIKNFDLKLDKDGLFVRNEWEKDVSDCEIDYVMIEKFLGFSPLNEVESPIKLVKIVETDFIRRKQDIMFNNSLIEIAVDYGKVIGRKKEEFIKEVELELKEGKVNDLLSCRDWFLKEYDSLKIGKLSKFARGLSLYKDLSGIIDKKKH